MGAGDVDALARGAGGAGEPVTRERAASPAGGAARLPARAPDDRAHRRRGRVLRARRQRARSCCELLAWARASGARGQRRRLGLEPAGRRRGRARAWWSSSTASWRAIDRRGRADRVRRRRAPAGGRRARGARGAVGDRVRRQHPGHRRRRGADERERLRRRAGDACSSGSRSRPPTGAAAPRAGASWASPTAARTSARARSSRARRSLLDAARTPRRSRRRSPRCARRRHEAQPQGIKTFGSTFKNPEDPRAEGRSAGLLLAEAGCNGLAVGGARFAPKHANFIENTGTATHRGRARGDGRGPPPRARALRRGARAGGADARRRALSLADGRGSRARGRRQRRWIAPSPRASPPDRPLAAPLAPAAAARRARRAGGPARGRALRRPHRAAPAGAALAALARRRRLRIALLALLVALPLLGGGWLWLRHSSLVAVEHVQISGVHGPEAQRDRSGADGAARRMSTLDVHTGALRAAVAPLPRGARRAAPPRASPTACASAWSSSCRWRRSTVGGARTAVAADGVVLGPALLSGSLPTRRAACAAAGRRARACSGAAPARRADRAGRRARRRWRSVVARVFTGPQGLTVAMRNGLLVYFGDATRPHAKWLSLARVLADPSSGGRLLRRRAPARAPRRGLPGRRRAAERHGRSAAARADRRRGRRRESTVGGARRRPRRPRTASAPPAERAGGRRATGRGRRRQLRRSAAPASAGEAAPASAARKPRQARRRKRRRSPARGRLSQH